MAQSLSDGRISGCSPMWSPAVSTVQKTLFHIPYINWSAIILSHKEAITTHAVEMSNPTIYQQAPLLTKVLRIFPRYCISEFRKLPIEATPFTTTITKLW